MEKKKVLLLEDDANLSLILQEHLQMNGFDVVVAGDGEIGREEFGNQAFDICLVDIMMPRKDGFTFAREVRQTNQTIPLIFLTARSLKDDKIEGFKIGCDDYITKPFSIEELLLRMEAVLRRCRGGAEPSVETVFKIGSYSFDVTRQTLVRGRKKQKLTTKETELLRLLSVNMNQTVLRDDALRQIWNDDSYFSGRSMDVFVSKLRKYLKADPDVEILGIHGKGFRLVVGD